MWNMKKTLYLVLVLLVASLAYGFISSGSVLYTDSDNSVSVISLLRNEYINKYLLLPLNYYYLNFSVSLNISDLKNTVLVTYPDLAFHFDYNLTDEKGRYGFKNYTAFTNGKKFYNVSVPSYAVSGDGNTSSLQFQSDTDTDYEIYNAGDLYQDRFVGSLNGSISFWVYPTYDDTNSQKIFELAKGPALIGCGYFSNPQLYNFTCYTNHNGGGEKIGGIMNISKWYHVVYTYEGGKGYRIYMNGTLMANTSLTGVASAANLRNVLGTDTNGEDDWAGMIDELYFYNRTLSAQDVISLYDYGKLYRSDATITARIGGDSIPYNSSISNMQTGVTIDLNASYIQDVMDEGCTCSNCTLQGTYCLLPVAFKSDLNNTLTTYNFTIEITKKFYIIDERENTAFDVKNPNSTRLYISENNTYIDLKNLGVNQTNYTVYWDKARLEIGYDNGDVISRYIDTDYTPKDARICANVEGVAHYEQLLLSSIQRLAILKNTYADCYVAADDTRFGYQDGFVLKAYTTPAQYELQALVKGVLISLVGIDGSIANFIYVDNVEFRQQTTNISILGDTLTAEKTANNTITLYYQNTGGSNSKCDLTITRMDTYAEVFTKSNFNNMDSWTLDFNYATLSGVNQTTLFKAEVVTTSTEGIQTLSRYFDTNGKTGSLRSGVAVAFSILLVVFGLTFTVSRSAFSWFGILMIIGSLGVLSFAVPVWYITFMMAVEFIILIYAIIIMLNQNQQTLT